MGTDRRRALLAATLGLVLAAPALTGCTPGLGSPATADELGAAASATPTLDPTGAASPSPTATATASGSRSASPAAAAAAVPAPAPVVQAPTQMFPVGVRQVNLTRGDRPLRTVLWYPATTAGTGATPAAGAYPLVLFSHGLTATPEAYQRVTSRIAAAGFIVAAPAYPYTNGGAAMYNPADLINQPADGSAVISAVLALGATAGDPLAGHIDGSRIAAAGHSAGGYTTAGMLAGARDDRLRAAIVIAGGSLGGAYRGPTASVLFIHGDSDPVVGYSVGRSAYGMVPWPKAFLTVVGGDHSSYLFGSGSAATAVSAGILDFLRLTLYSDVSARSRLAASAVPSATTFETSL